MIVQVTCSNNPFKLETETDLGRILAFFGQIRDRLATFLNDPHERIVPDVMEWNLTECDVNRDIKLGDCFHYSGAKIQLKHFHHLLRIYVKSMGRDRIEETKSPCKPPIEAINDIFNPNERVEKLLTDHEKLLRQILDKLGENPAS